MVSFRASLRVTSATHIVEVSIRLLKSSGVVSVNELPFTCRVEKICVNNQLAMTVCSVQSGAPLSLPLVNSPA
jgi:hypothetical protein